MKTVTIDETGEKYQIIRRDELPLGKQFVIQCAPISKPKKTLMDIAKSFFKSEERFREQLPMQAAVYDAIEERLKALEEAAKK